MARRVLILTTGGTIGGEVADESSADTDAFDPVEYVDWLAARGGYQDLDDIELDQDRLPSLDSSDVGPREWRQIVERIVAVYDRFDGFVVTHGTNTLGHTAAALSFALPNLGKPVVITGSQLPHHWPASDAIGNLCNAVRVAAGLGGSVYGVMCVFGSQVIAGTRVKKVTDFDFDAFQSSATGRLGRLGRRIQMDPHALERHHGYLERVAQPARHGNELVATPSFDMRLLSLTEYPGMDVDLAVDLLAYAVNGPDARVRGVIFRAFGDGDASSGLRRAFDLLHDLRVPVVVTTQVPSGSATLTLNQPGKALREAGLAVPARDMSIEAITTKLAWLLAQDLDYDVIRELMGTDVRGEIGVLDETASGGTGFSPI